MTSEAKSAVDLYWLPLGAGGTRSGSTERPSSTLSRGSTTAPLVQLYHSALVVEVPEGRFVIEQAPASRSQGV